MHFRKLTSSGLPPVKFYLLAAGLLSVGLICICVLTPVLFPRSCLFPTGPLSFLSQRVTTPSPVVILPGDGGSQAFASIEGSPLFSVWINFEYLFFPNFLQKYFMLEYDVQKRGTTDSANVTVVFPGWGETWSMESLDVNVHDKTIYFREMVQRLTDPKRAGLVTNLTLRGAPYDFRKAPNELQVETERLRELVEETVRNAGGQRVVLLAHSYGNVVAQHFLKVVVNETWKQTYLRAYVAVSAPLAGAVKAMKLEASGDNLGVVVERGMNFRTLQRSLPSTALLMPHPKYWPENETIAFTPKKNYTAHNYQDFFLDMGFVQGYNLREDTWRLMDPDYVPTGVSELYCLYGVDMPTETTLHWGPPTFWNPGFPDATPTVQMGPGDGTVNLRSLELCQQWPGVVLKTFSKVEHMTTVRNAAVIDFVEQLVIQGDQLRRPSLETGSWWNWSVQGLLQLLAW